MGLLGAHGPEGARPDHLGDPRGGNLGTFWLQLAAMLAASLTEGKAGVRAISTRMLKLRIDLRWYLAPLLIPLLLSLAAVGIEVALGGASPIGTVLPLKVAPLYFLSQIIVHLLTEEPGWRGFALPKLQERYSPLISSLILGLLWGCWHAPLFLIPGRPQAAMPFLGFLLAVTSATMVMAWVQNRAGSSFVAVLFHASMNTGFAAFAVLTSTSRLFWITVGLWVGCAVLLALRTGLGDREPSKVLKAF